MKLSINETKDKWNYVYIKINDYQPKQKSAQVSVNIMTLSITKISINESKYKWDQA
jgi:hypothetical protein